MLPNLFDVPLVLEMRPAIRLTDDELFDLCQINDFLRIEQDAQGRLIIALPVYSYISHYNFVLTSQVGNWAFENKQGFVFDSSSGFVLPNGAMRSPDCSWVLKTRLAHLTPRTVGKVSTSVSRFFA